jgi:hypothetical protein
MSSVRIGRASRSFRGVGMTPSQIAFLTFIKQWDYNTIQWLTADCREPTVGLQILPICQVSCGTPREQLPAEEFARLKHFVEPSVHMKDGLRLTDAGKQALENEIA